MMKNSNSSYSQVRSSVMSTSSTCMSKMWWAQKLGSLRVYKVGEGSSLAALRKFMPKPDTKVVRTAYGKMQT